MSRPLAHLSALRSFEAAARLGSFQAAADELNISPSAVSHNIRALEDYVGHKLFNRLTRAIELNEAGGLLFDDVAKGFRHLEQGIHKVQNMQRNHVLTVSTGPAIAAKWLIPRLYDFEEKCPEIEIRVSSTNKIVDLARGDADIAIRHGIGNYEGLNAILLFAEKYSPVCTPEIAAQLKEPVDILKFRLLFDDQASLAGKAPLWQDWFHSMGLEEIELPKGQHFAQGDHAIQASIYGAGILFGRLSLANPDISAGRLTLPFPKILSADIGNYFVTLAGREKEPAISAFLNWLKSEMELHQTHYI